MSLAWTQWLGIAEVRVRASVAVGQPGPQSIEALRPGAAVAFLAERQRAFEPTRLARQQLEDSGSEVARHERLGQFRPSFSRRRPKVRPMEEMACRGLRPHGSFCASGRQSTRIRTRG